MAWIAGAVLAAQAVALYASLGKMGADSHAYWLTGHVSSMYAMSVEGGRDAYLYSPAFAQAIWPLTHLPWPVFCGVWMVAEVAAFAWLFRPLGWRWVGPLVLVCASEWTIGNVVPFMAVAAVMGLRSPGWWSAVALMKPSMGLGPVWFAARGEWRKVGLACAVTLAIVGVSFVIAPGAWQDWLGFLQERGGSKGGTLLPRMAAAVGLTVVAARLDRPWLLAPAMWLATPVPAGAASLTILAAIPRLVAPRVAVRRQGADDAVRRQEVA